MCVSPKRTGQYFVLFSPLWIILFLAILLVALPSKFGKENEEGKNPNLFVRFMLTGQVVIVNPDSEILRWVKLYLATPRATVHG
jgi:hypothetical protein